MKRYLLIILIGLAFLFNSCSKGGGASDPTGGNTGSNNGGGTTTPAYVVKTIGVSRINIGTDANNKLTVADIYGGGNHIILKAGTGNKMDMETYIVYGTSATTLYPDVQLAFQDQLIDNGNPPTDTAGGTGAVIKLKGFDKQKTGYNQLNLVMQKYVWAAEGAVTGFKNNLTYMKMTKNSPDGYGPAFIKRIFSGDVNASTVEIAAPQSAKPYITRDEIITYGQCNYNDKTNTPFSVDLGSSQYRVFFDRTALGNGFSFGSSIKCEWVNANNATITKESDYIYTARFNNMKTGGLDQVVDPADSVSKVFLRVTGFNPAICGYNQLRLFIASDGTNASDGGLQMLFGIKLATPPSITMIKEAYSAKNLYVILARPRWN